jgi:hypothetical protein
LQLQEGKLKGSNQDILDVTTDEVVWALKWHRVGMKKVRGEDADPDIPILKQAKAECGKCSSRV